MRSTLLVLLAMMLMISACQKKSAEIVVRNPINLERNDELVILDWKQLMPDMELTPSTQINFFDGQQIVPYQILDSQKVAILLDFKPSEQKIVTLTLSDAGSKSIPKRAHAEISVRKGGTFNGEKWVGGQFVSVKHLAVGKEHFAHDELIRYEGPGWESDRIAFRLYLDERNALDVFGKRTKKIILPIVGHDTSKTYHEMNWWGMDILKVGETFGAGSFALYLPGKDFFEKVKAKDLSYQPPDLLAPKAVDSLVCRILEDGPLRAAVEILYKGWEVAGQKINVQARHYIQAGSYLLRHELAVESKSPSGIAFGVMQPKNSKLQSWTDNGYWQNVTGIPSLGGDSLTIFFYFKKPHPVQFMAEKNGNRVAYAAPQARKVMFWSGALWQGNFSGQSFAAVCKTFAEEQSQRLNHPIQVKYKKD